MKRGKNYFLLIFALLILICFNFTCAKSPQKTIELINSKYTYAGSDITINVNLNGADVSEILCDQVAIKPIFYSLGSGKPKLKTIYLDTLVEGTHNFVLKTSLGDAAFEIKILPLAPVEAPTILPEVVDIDLNNWQKLDLEFDVAYHNGIPSDIVLNDKSVAVANYTILATKLYLLQNYVATLGKGTHVFTLKTNGGECNFTVKIGHSGIEFSDIDRVKEFKNEDINFELSLGDNTLKTLKIQGVPMAETDYAYSDTGLTIKKTFLNKLKDGMYHFELSTQNDKHVTFCITKGMAAEEVYYLDFESFFPTTKGFGQNLATSVENGMSKVVCEERGTLLHFGVDKIEYDFIPNKTYSLSMDIKLENIVSGTSSVQDLLMPIWFATEGINADIAYLRYDERKGLYITSDRAGSNVSLTQNGDHYHIYCEFTYKANYHDLQAAIWMQGGFFVDNIRMQPAMGEYLKLNDQNITVFEKENTTTLNLGDMSILGISVDGRFLDANECQINGGNITILATFFEQFTNETVMKYVIYTERGELCGSILYMQHMPTLVGESFYYTMSGQDLSFQLHTDTMTVSKIATLNGIELVRGTDYILSGEILTIKVAILDRIFGEKTFQISFEESIGKLDFTIESELIFKMNFDDYLPPEEGYGDGAKLSVIKDGIDGNMGMVTVSKSPATLIAMGTSFTQVPFHIGKTYAVSMQFMANSVGKNNNILEGSSVFMPVTFGSGKDVLYLFYGEDNEFTISPKEIGNGIASLTKNDLGVYTLNFEFVPTKECTQLTFDLWRDCILQVDNLQITIK